MILGGGGGGGGVVFAFCALRLGLYWAALACCWFHYAGGRVYFEALFSETLNPKPLKPQPWTLNANLNPKTAEAWCRDLRVYWGF